MLRWGMAAVVAVRACECGGKVADTSDLAIIIPHTSSGRPLAAEGNSTSFTTDAASSCS